MTEAMTRYEKHEERALQPITPMTLLQSAQSTGASVEQLQQLMELQIRWEANEARKAYNEAMAQFKSENLIIYKRCEVGYRNKDGSFTGYKHANLGDIVSIVSPALSKYGLSHSWETSQDGTTVQVTCKIAHRLGHAEGITLSAAPDQSGKKNSIQAVGSTVTYLQRYTLISILGLAVHDMDDDGKGGGDTKGETGGCLTDEKFETFLPTWKDALLSRKRTINDIIEAGKKNNQALTEAQIDRLKEVVHEANLRRAGEPGMERAAQATPVRQRCPGDDG